MITSALPSVFGASTSSCAAGCLCTVVPLTFATKHQDFEIHFLSTVFNTYAYRRVSFSAIDIIISKEEEIFGPKILMMETTISIFV